jgi:hypothetical protein
LSAGSLYDAKVVTRGVNSASKGTARQTVGFIMDGHDTRRDPGSDSELTHIVRVRDGWKTDLEGGRVPLVGIGELKGELTSNKCLRSSSRVCPRDRCQ